MGFANQATAVPVPIRAAWVPIRVKWCDEVLAAMLAASKLMKVSSKLAPAPLLPILNSPAARVKDGRERGPTVLETLRKQEQAREEADAAAAAKRRGGAGVTTL